MTAGACRCGVVLGALCQAELGPDAVTVQIVPEDLRATMQAAGGPPWPAAVTLVCAPDCADYLMGCPDPFGLLPCAWPACPVHGDGEPLWYARTIEKEVL